MKMEGRKGGRAGLAGGNNKGGMTVGKMAGLLCLLLALTLIPSALAEEWDEEEEEWEMPGYVDGDTLILPEGITALGCYAGEWLYDPDTDEWSVQENPEEEAWFENAYSFLGGYFGEQEFSNVQWPSTVKCLGAESFVGYHFPKLTLPVSLEKIYPYALDGWIDVLRIETTLPWDQIGELRWDGNGMDNVIGAYETPEDHPLYQAVDGVLFTRDGKTLLSYPNGRKDTHYDVPKGVERIADWAFVSEYLQTISLPIGLKSVGDYGFSGCTRLQAIALPLTVTDIGEHVFDDCVSLELVSLPEGMKADKTSNDWYVVYYPDDRLYRGDNGDTLPGVPADPEEADGEEDDLAFLRMEGRIKGRDAVKRYEGSTGSERYMMTDPGVYRLNTYRCGRILVRDPLNNEPLGWVDAEYVEYLPAETLFTVADVRPQAEMAVWWDHLPTVNEDWPAWETKIPLDVEYTGELYGPFVKFSRWSPYIVFGCRLQDAEIFRWSDGTDHVYGLLYNDDLFADIPLRDGPGGEIQEYLMAGTQVRVLSEDEAGFAVTTGIVEGWTAKEYVKIIPEQKEGN